MKREPTQKEKLFLETNGACIYCGRPLSLESMEIEHIIPKAKGGPDSFSNLVCSCPECNARKKDVMPQEFLEGMTEKKQKAFRNRLNHLCESGKISQEKSRILLEGQATGDVEAACISASSPEVQIPVGNIGGYSIVVSLKVGLKINLPSEC